MQRRIQYAQSPLGFGFTSLTAEVRESCYRGRARRQLCRARDTDSFQADSTSRSSRYLTRYAHVQCLRRIRCWTSDAIIGYNSGRTNYVISCTVDLRMTVSPHAAHRGAWRSHNDCVPEARSKAVVQLHCSPVGEHGAGRAVCGQSMARDTIDASNHGYTT